MSESKRIIIFMISTILIATLLTNIPINSNYSQFCDAEPLCHPSISVIKNANPSSGIWGTEINFTIEISNTGGPSDYDFTTVEVIDTLPEGLTYLTSSIPPDNINENEIIWYNISSLNLSESITFYLYATIDNAVSGILENNVHVTGWAANGAFDQDCDSANTITLSPINVEKSVHYNCNGPWDDEGIVIDMAGPHAYDFCTFRINITNLVTVPLNITIEDILTDGIINGDHYYPYYPDYVDGNTIIWYLDGIHHDLLLPYETKTFAIRADMGDCDQLYINTVKVISQYESTIPFINTDSAYVKWINCSLDELDVNQSLFDRGLPIRHAIDGDWAGAQNITPTLDALTSVDIYLRKFGTPEFNLTVELREDNPQGALLDALSFTPEEVPSSWDWFEVDFTDITITPGTDYFIVCPPAPPGVTTSFGYEWGYAFGDQYPDGSFWFTRDGGGLWHDLSTMYEFCFRTYGFS